MTDLLGLFLVMPIPLLVMPLPTTPVPPMPSTLLLLLWWNYGFRNLGFFFGIFFSEIHLFGCQSCQASMLIWHDRRCVEVLIYLRVHASRTPGQKSYPTYHNMLLQVLAMSAISDVGLAWIFINQWCTRTQTTQKNMRSPLANTKQHVAAGPSQHHRQCCQHCPLEHHHVGL